MGLFLSRLTKWFGLRFDTQHKILLLGLDNAGKTTLLYWLRLRSAIVTIPTVGMNVEEVRVPGVGISLLTWDIGGQEKLRKLWSRFFHDAHGVIFVVDSADVSRFDEARAELARLLNDPALDSVPFLILSNKQDLPGALQPNAVGEQLEVSQPFELHTASRAIVLRPAIATTGKGICEALEEFGRRVKEYAKQRRFS